jgi:hypothetical protein
MTHDSQILEKTTENKVSEETLQSALQNIKDTEKRMKIYEIIYSGRTNTSEEISADDTEQKYNFEQETQKLINQIEVLAKLSIEELDSIINSIGNNEE